MVIALGQVKSDFLSRLMNEMGLCYSKVLAQFENTFYYFICKLVSRICHGRSNMCSIL